MIKYGQLSTIFSGIGFNVTEYNYENVDSLSPPFCVYVCSDETSVSADSISYMQLLRVRLILVSDSLDFTNQAKIETRLNTNSIFFKKEFDFDEEERIYTTTYDFEVLG